MVVIKQFHEEGGSHGEKSTPEKQRAEIRTRLFRIERYLATLAWETDEELTSIIDATVQDGTWIDVLSNHTVNLTVDKPLLVRSGSIAVEYNTITLACAAATSGDYVLIPPRHYTEDFTVPEGVTIYGMDSMKSRISGTITMSAGSVVCHLLWNRTFADDVYYKGINIVAEGLYYIFDCRMYFTQNGGGGTYGVYVDAPANVWIDHCYINCIGHNGEAVHATENLEGAAGPVVIDTDTEVPIVADELYNDFDILIDPDPGVYASVYFDWKFSCDAVSEYYTYFSIKWHGKVTVGKSWGDMLTHTEAYIRIYTSPAGQGLAEYYIPSSNTWDDNGWPDQQGGSVWNDTGTLDYKDQPLLFRIRRTAAFDSYVRIVLRAQCLRELTDSAAYISNVWSVDKYPSGLHIQYTYMYGSYQDLYVDGGDALVQACTYRDEYCTGDGLIIPEPGDRSTWDLDRGADMHASDISNGTPLYHWSSEDLIAEIPQATTEIQGKVELATAAETQIGSDAERAITPAALATVISLYDGIDTAKIIKNGTAILILNATGGESTTLNVLQSGNALVGVIAAGSIGRITQWKTIYEVEASTLIKSGAGVLTLSAAAAYALTVAANASVAGTNTGDVTLAASADEVLGISSQALSLDSKAVAMILAGPLSGAAAAPTYKHAAHVAVAGGFGSQLFTAANGLALWGPGCARTPTAWTATRGQVATLSGAFHEVQGPWAGSRALMVEAAATNLVTSEPSFETGTTGWTTGLANTIAQSSDVAVDGLYSLKCTYQDSTNLALYPITLTATVHSLSMYVWVPTAYDGSILRVRLDGFTGATGLVETFVDMSKRDQWQRVTTSATIDAGDLSGNLVLYDPGATPTAGRFVYIDAVQCEATACATSFTTGTRTATVVNLDAHCNLLNDNNTVSHSMWVQMPYDADATWPESSSYILDIRGADNNNRTLFRYIFDYDTFTVYLNGGLRITTAAQTFLAGDWLLFDLVLDYANDLYYLYINGILAGSATTALTAPTGQVAWKLGAGYGATAQVGWIFGEYAVFDSALSAENVAAIYAQGRPLVDGGALKSPVVNGYGLRLPFSIADVSDPPTDAQLTVAFGSQPDGFSAILDDAGAATKCWKVWRASSAWWYEEITKAV